MFKWTWDKLKSVAQWRPQWWAWKKRALPPGVERPGIERGAFPPELFWPLEPGPPIVALDISTQTARMSAIMLCLPFRAIYPVSDGTIGQGDRQCVAYQYAGVLAGAPSAAPTTKMGMSPILLFPRKRPAGQL